ncbi:hypothetical protein L195_g056452, partial [Trifolium pratense]
MPLEIDLNLPYNDSEAVDSIIPVIECNTTQTIASESNDSTTVSIDMNFFISEVNEEGQDTLNDEGGDDEYHEIVSDEGGDDEYHEIVSDDDTEAQHALNDNGVDSHT